jgi:hypothetical protein
MSNTDLNKYVPNVYEDVVEMCELINTENELFDELKLQVDKVENNQFITQADIDGIKEFESLYGIVSNPLTETLDFRRNRLLNRKGLNAPFTMRFLKNKLDDIIGIGNWIMTTDFNNFIVYIESVDEDLNWLHEIQVTFTKIKPCNMLFIGKPNLSAQLEIGEQIETGGEITYNYKLGTTWVLGALPFISTSGMEVLKTMATPSLQSEMFNDVANFIASNVTKVKLNDVVEISTFVTKNSTGDTATIEYNVLMSMGIVEVTNIKLLDNTDAILSNSSVYIPVNADIVLKHTIKSTEKT